MELPRLVKYAGRTFRLQTNGRYYQDQNRCRTPERLLHRRIWHDLKGPIPRGYDIHHIDEDWTNNDPLNLELKKVRKHRAEHATKRLEDPHYAATREVQLVKARELAKAWHSTPEGLEWHSKNGAAAWKHRTRKRHTCLFCKKMFWAFNPRAKVCSRNCGQKIFYRTKTPKDTRTCLICGGSFTVHSFRKTVTCSPQCNAVNVARIKKAKKEKSCNCPS